MNDRKPKRRLTMSNQTKLQTGGINLRRKIIDVFLLLACVLALCQAAQAQVEINWATNAGSIAVASSTALGNITNINNGKIDGNYNNGDVWISNPLTSQFCEVDLDTTHPIGRVVYWGRTDCCPDQSQSIAITILDAPGG